MRDFALTVILLGIVPLILYRPHVGLLAWAWVAFMNPHREVYAYLHSANLNLIIASLTIVALTFSQEKWFPRLSLTLVVMLSFAAWTTLTTYTAIDYSMASTAWSLNIKTFVLAVLVATLIERPSRIHALILIIVISLGYWGAMAAMQTLASMGHANLTGPPGTMITDNNHLALALVLVLPLVEYCRFVSANKIVRRVSVGILCLLIVAISGSYSRGGVIALAVVLALLWWKTKRHLLAASFIGIALGLGLLILPQKWSDRMATIQTFQSDQSFHSRWEAWMTALRIGLDRPVVGAGFRATEDESTYEHYRPEGDSTKFRAVHSAYFQVLAEHGFVGLGLFAFMFFLAIRDCRWVAKKCSIINDLDWLVYLAGMLEIGFIGYAVGGAALSVAYYDVFVVLIAVSSLLRDYAQREIEVLQDIRRNTPARRAAR
jgi:probable O-glycosylation ligase (exosortase A-associated)